MSTGLALAGATALGSAACEFGRKRLTKGGLDAATIVSLVCLLVGLAGLSGITAMTGAMQCPGASFWPPALASAGLSAVTATLLTKAYSNNDVCGASLQRCVLCLRVAPRPSADLPGCAIQLRAAGVSVFCHHLCSP